MTQQNDSNNENQIQFVTEVDETPAIWNFLLGLDRNDLIAELVQNDLDQDATNTVIEFQRDQLVCEGNGTPVDSDGWKRLRYMLGAGHSVHAKRGKIGVKNHGLKTAFAIGDELHLSSAGRKIVQTLFADGRDKAPRPGAYKEPQSDPQSPIHGCRIAIKYRRGSIESSTGEAFSLKAVNNQEIDTLFKSACKKIPEQFAGIVSPEVVPKYEITLRHWRLGEARFKFSCTRRPKVKCAKTIECLRRYCIVSGEASSSASKLREEAFRRLLPLKGQLKSRVADFYRHQNRFFVEVSWPIDTRGKPKTGTGKFRYPIGYPEGSSDALTGHGAFFNAPIVSDTERHGPARNDSTNEWLRKACEALMIDTLRLYVIPKWGPAGLNPLVPPNPEKNCSDEAVRPLLANLVHRDAMPCLRWRDATKQVLKAKKRKIRNTKISRRRSNYRFVVPVATWNKDAVHTSLSVICPRSEKQLDPRIHPYIVRLLTDRETKGFCEDFITFDEQDALDRAKGENSQYFSEYEDREKEFSDPSIVYFYLDVIRDSLANDECSPEMEEALQKVLLLPDMHAKPIRFQDIYSKAPLPHGVPGLTLPPILHSKLTSHPLFQKRKWRRPKYTMAKFIESEMLQGADAQVRKSFWKWLYQNKRSIRSREIAKLASLAVWPDIQGNLYTLQDFCSPNSSRVAKILGKSICHPHASVCRSKIVTFGKKNRTSIRRIPSQDEINNWLTETIKPFSIGKLPDKIAALERLETNLIILLSDKGIARLIKKTGIALPALAQDGSIQCRNELVMPSKGNKRLQLLPQFMLKDTSHTAKLNKISPVLYQPTAAMLVSTFEEDCSNFTALHARLHLFIKLTEPADNHRLKLESMPILPVNDRAHAPRDLVFKGTKGDYWGNWKTQISGTGLSQEDQQRYKDVGVTSAYPNPDTSRNFFEWLSVQNASVIKQHVSCILRHILHPQGPEMWAKTFTDVRFIPVEAYNGLQLVPLRKVHSTPVYLPDVKPELAKAVVAKDRRIALAVVQVNELRRPISEQLQKLGMRSLREEIGEPERVAGHGNINQAPKDFYSRFETLQSEKFRNDFPKRLSKAGVSYDLVHHDWHARLLRIKQIQFADCVKAHYRFRGRVHYCEVDAGFDPKSGTFLVKQNDGIGPNSIYDTIAQLIFKSSARLADLWALERMLDMEIYEPSFGKPTSESSLPKGNEAPLNGGDPDEDNETLNIDETELGEVISGHAPFTPDPERNIPDPGPIDPVPSSSEIQEHGRNRRSDPCTSGNESSPAPAHENKHIEQLKREHYASHCQICLCQRPPKELAPAGSYIQWEEVRRRVVEAHHVDPKSAGGARNAGNLILLCKLHHDAYGRKLTRAAVIHALRQKKKDKTVRFDYVNGACSEVRGLSIEIVISGTNEIVKLFFTHSHSDYWLSHAPSANK